MRCLNCEKKLRVGSFKSYCNQSCSTSYTNRMRPKTPRKKVSCLFCKNVFSLRPSARWGKYCSNACQGKYAKAERQKLIRSGLNSTLKGMREFLIEKFGNQCRLCGQLPEWNGKPLTLQLDHKDGDSDNNHWKNMRLLCPNCHTQTPTYGSKGLGNRYKKDASRNVKLRAYKASR